MDNLSISLPKNLIEFVEKQASKAGYETASDYLRALIDEAERLAAKDELQEKLLNGLRSPKREMKNDDWMELERQMLENSPKTGNIERIFES